MYMITRIILSEETHDIQLLAPIILQRSSVWIKKTWEVFCFMLEKKHECFVIFIVVKTVDNVSKKNYFKHDSLYVNFFL